MRFDPFVLNAVRPLLYFPIVYRHRQLVRTKSAFFISIAAVSLCLDSNESLAQESDLIFKPAGTEVTSQLPTDLEKDIESVTKPLGYRRHRIIEIDVRKLTHELHRSFQAYEERKPNYSILIPLFDDRTVDFSITSGLQGNFGVHIAKGAVLETNPADFSVSFVFAEESLSKATIESANHWYLIRPSTQVPYFVLIESEYVDAPM